MSAGSRKKGHNLERRVVNLFKAIGYKSKRILEYQIENANGVDVEAYPFLIQTKCHKDYVSVSTINEIKREGIKILITQGDYKPPMVVIPLKDFLEGLKDPDYFRGNSGFKDS
jgi:hypothetical protein